MTDTTTIEIMQWQREELEARKNYDGEAVKKVIGRLLQENQKTPAEEGVAVGDLRDQLDRIESAAKEATNAAQNAERAAEELGGQR